MFFDDIKTLYDLGAPESRRDQSRADLQRLPKRRDRADWTRSRYLPLTDLQVIDLDTAQAVRAGQGRRSDLVKLDVPIVDDKQSAHIKITGTFKDGSYKLLDGELVFERTLHGLRNTVLLPAGWDVTAVSQSGTIGLREGRAFVALINLNAENNYKVTIRARSVEAARFERFAGVEAL